MAIPQQLNFDPTIVGGFNPFARNEVTKFGTQHCFFKRLSGQKKAAREPLFHKNDSDYAATPLAVSAYSSI
jgi:hypothetical protein